jgi:hypothetical protein
MRTTVLASLLALTALLGCSSRAHAWGRIGHRVISRFSERQLTAKGSAEISAILAEGESIADASLWADEHRRELPKTAPWHYVYVPLDEPKYGSKWSADDPKKGCVVDKINEFKSVLKDPSKTKEEKRFALRFLIHCIEDMHMPMHVGDNHDRGGNDTQVRFYDRGTNMHRLWDTDMIERVSKDEDVWLKDLASMASPESPQDVPKGTVEDWATESLVAACAAYYDPARGERLKSGTKLGEQYFDLNLPIVKQRMYRAGVRLATVLNECFGN